MEVPPISLPQRRVWITSHGNARFLHLPSPNNFLLLGLILAILKSQPLPAHSHSQDRHIQWRTVHVESPTRTAGRGAGCSGSAESASRISGVPRNNSHGDAAHRHSTRVGRDPLPLLPSRAPGHRPKPLSLRSPVVSCSSSWHHSYTFRGPAAGSLLKNGVKLSSLITSVLPY